MTSREQRVFLGTVKEKKIGLECLLRASARGDGLYLYLPQDIVSVYGIMAGDRVKTKLIASFRLISSLEQEEGNKKREERIESVLAVPRQRGPRRKKVTETKEENDEEQKSWDK